MLKIRFSNKEPMQRKCRQYLQGVTKEVIKLGYIVNLDKFLFVIPNSMNYDT